jgi:ABC-type transporter Mla subunit MlaD
MAKSAEQSSDFVRCAEAVEREVRRLEELSRAACRVKLGTEKSIGRAARELQQTLAQQERLGAELRRFSETMSVMQARQQAALEPLSERALEIQARMTRLAEHMQRFGALGAQASETANALRDVTTSPEEAAGTSRKAQHASALIGVDERFRALLDEARSLADSAEHEEFPDIAREAESLRQRLQAMRGRLSELVRAQSTGSG